MGAMKHAVQIGDMDTVLDLMQLGFDVQTADYDGRTILHVAAAAGDLRLVEVLVKQFDANAAIRDRCDGVPGSLHLRAIFQSKSLLRCDETCELPCNTSELFVSLSTGVGAYRSTMQWTVITPSALPSSSSTAAKRR